MDPLPKSVEVVILCISLGCLGIVGASIFLWTKGSNFIDRAKEFSVPPSPWKLRGIDFGLFVLSIVSVTIVSQLLLVSLIGLLGHTPEDSLDPGTTALLIIGFQVPLLLVYLAFKKAYRHEFGDSVEPNTLSWFQSFKTALLYFLKYLPVVWIVSFISNAVSGLLVELGLIEELNPQEIIGVFSDTQSPLFLLILAFSAVVVAPIVEELVFRQGLYRYFKSKVSLLISQLGSAFVFALIHGNLLSFFSLWAVGIVLAKCYEETGDIRVPIIFHSAFNAFTISIVLIVSFLGLENF